MGDNLPLIPEKEAVCADVRPVLREVFRELDCLPPLPAAGQHAPDLVPWLPQFESECRELWQREEELKQKHARRVSREPLPNIYQLHPPKETPTETRGWKNEKGIIQRSDLMPTIVQNANKRDTLWVRNILNTSSGDLAPAEIRGSQIRMPIRLESPRSSLQSMSIGELDPRPTPLPPPVVPPPPLPEVVVCFPPQLDFVNFTVGQLHTQSLRLVNVSQQECRLSVRPPRAAEIDLQLGPRGLALTAGAAVQIKVHFRPRNVRVLRDELLIRVSTGRSLVVPICCYMEPPLLHILVPAVASSVYSWCKNDDGEYTLGGGGGRGCDVLELGAKLLGDIHDVHVLLRCEAPHASFFLLTEDTWLGCYLDKPSPDGWLVLAPFAVRPASWRGGGAVRARLACDARSRGLHVAALRVLASSPAARPLTLLADALLYRPDHVTLQAHEKDYDICSEDDPACESYVHLGSAFPRQPLSAVVELVNHSAVVYSYYWTSRPWGACSCWEERRASQGSLGPEDTDTLCVGAREARDLEREGRPPRQAEHVHAEPTHGSAAPRSTSSLRVCVPDVGEMLGTRRVVLMLILKDIPKASFPKDFDPMIVKTREVEIEPIPGIEERSRCVCDVVCAQLEVWWRVAPVRFVLMPPVIPLTHSRRVKCVEVQVEATQLTGVSIVHGCWRLPPCPFTCQCQSPPPPAALTPARSCTLRVTCPLPVADRPHTDVITLQACEGSWSSSCVVVSASPHRAPAPRPARAPLGALPPAARVSTHITLYNDTHQHISWRAVPFRWCGDSGPLGACADSARTPCVSCRARRCSCALLRPRAGDLGHARQDTVTYDMNAPEHDGCVVTLVQFVHAPADEQEGEGVEGGVRGAQRRSLAALVSYRVLAPRLVLRVLPCRGDKTRDCAACELDAGAARGTRGTATLRPRAALTPRRAVCARLRVNNLTPIATRVVWDSPLENDALNIVFFPNELEVAGHAEVEFQVVLEPRRVCSRRVFVRRARVQHAARPLYLLVDAAVAGLEIVFEVPIGHGLTTDSTLNMRRTQREESAGEGGGGAEWPGSAEDLFQEEDRRRAEQAKNICSCRCELVYVAPEPRPRPPDQPAPIEIVTSPPPLTRVCACFTSRRPTLPAHAHAPALQFTDLPLHTVRSRRVVVRNEGACAARCRVSLRTHQRTDTPRSLEKVYGDRSPAEGAAGAGLSLWVSARAAVLEAHGVLVLTVHAAASCWGLYRDQLLIQVEGVEPLVLDVWAESRAAPLKIAISPRPDDETPPQLWLSAADPVRWLRVVNRSRAPLLVLAYMLAEHEQEQTALPFRLYARAMDAAPRVCACTHTAGSLYGEGSTEISSQEEQMDTGFDLYLAPDYGRQDNEHFTVSPECMCVGAHSWSEWRVSLLPPPDGQPAPRAALMLRARPLHTQGEGWYRGEPPAQLVRLREAPRAPLLKSSARELRVKLCALDLPYRDVLRVRKHFRIQNIGSGPLEMSARCAEPWMLIETAAGRGGCGTGCGCGGEGEEGPSRTAELALHLLPRSSMELCVEARVPWQAAPAPVAQWRRELTKLRFYDAHNVLLTIPLHLEVEYPAVNVEPAVLELGFVPDGDTRKSYFTVSHSSRTVTIDMVSTWWGPAGMRLWPRDFSLQPGARERLYVQYTAEWCGAPMEGVVRVTAACGAGAGDGAGEEGGGWCCATARVRAVGTRDSERRMFAHDHTDDTHLAPRGAASARS